MGVASKISNASKLVGIDFTRVGRTVWALPRFIGDFRRYRRQAAKSDSFRIRIRNLKPHLLDYTDQAGGAEGHYFFQDLWAARSIYSSRPSKHFDIGSRIDGFVAHVLSFMPVEVMDIRPLTSNVSGLTFVQADATNLANIPDNSVESLSCLHAAEHFGLGRYTDPVDPQACFKAMAAMQRVLQQGGRLYFSVPVGIERVEFNAHRVFDPQTVLDTFGGLRLLSFAAVDDHGAFHAAADPRGYSRARFACGMFEFSKQ